MMPLNEHTKENYKHTHTHGAHWRERQRKKASSDGRQNIKKVTNLSSASRFLFENNEAEKQTNKQKNEPNQKRQRRKKSLKQNHTHSA